MSKFTKRLSLFTALVMVLGLFAAFPVLRTVTANAEDPVNVAEGKQYKYSVAPFSSYSDGGAANEYHNGLLTKDGYDGAEPSRSGACGGDNGYVGYISKLTDYTVIVDLGGSFNVTQAKIDLFWDADNPFGSSAQPLRLDCAYSADELNWSTDTDIKDIYDKRPVLHSAGAASTRSAKTHRCDVAAEGVRYVKFTISTGLDNLVRLYMDEIEVIGTAAAAEPSSEEPSSEQPSEEPSSEQPSEEPSSEETSAEEPAVYTISPIGCVPNKQNAQAGELIVVKGIPVEHFVFDGWVSRPEGIVFGETTTDSNGLFVSSFTMPDHDVEIEFLLKEEKYPITCVQCTANMAEAIMGMNVEITATVPENWEFTGWKFTPDTVTAKANTASTTFVMPGEAVTVEALLTSTLPPPAEPVNVALDAEYKGSENSSTNGTGSYGDGGNWKEYHKCVVGDNGITTSGKLIDGKIITVPTNSTDKGCIEACVKDINNVQSGTYAVIFRLAEETDVSSVKVFLNDRTGRNYRGYPDKVEAFVGGSEDVAAAASLGAKGVNDYSVYEGSETARLCEFTTESPVTGKYVIVQFTIDAVVNAYPGKGVNSISEIEIWGNKAGEPVPTKYEVQVTGGTADKETAAEGETVTITATVPENQVFEKWTGNVEFANANEPVTTFKMPAENVSITASFKAPEPQLENIAPDAQYKASENCKDNGDGDQGEADWNAWHTGKLNDKVIATSCVDKNAECVEFWANNTSAAAPASSFIYFKLNHERAVNGVHMYFNVREDKVAGQSSWPSLIKVYVGSSETEYTLLGDASAVYRKVNDTVWDYYADVDAAMTGSYVVLEIACNTTDWIALTEVEIMGEPFTGPYNIVVGPEGKAGSNPSGTAYPGDTVTLSALAGDPGMRFAGWSGDVDLLSDPAVCPNDFVMPARDVAFEAMYEWALDTSKAGKYRCTADPNLRIRKLPNTDQGTEVLGAVNLDDIVYVEGVVDMEISPNRYWGLLTYNDIKGFASMEYLERVYDITVEGGTADKEVAAEGETVTITATVPENQVFEKWTGNAAFTNAEEAETTFAMPAENVSVTASFKSGTTPPSPTEPVNVAPKAEYRGDDIGTNSTGSFGEPGFWNINDSSQTNDNNVYHTGKLTDGEKPNDWSNKGAKGKNIEFGKSGWGVGPFRLYFKLAEETKVTQINAYAGMRDTGGNRAYPIPFNVYVGNSEDDVSEATLFGQADTVDESIVRNYTVSGDKTGKYVIIDTEIPEGFAVITFCEIEIFGIEGGEPIVPAEPLAAPVLKNSAPKMETYEIPTISWEAVPNAVGYDVYLDGVLVAEGITELSYVPSITTRSDYAGNTADENNDHYKVQVVAKGDGRAFTDSEKSAEAAIMYVEKPVDSQGNPVTSADIILDAGHGGRDPGAIGFETRHEADDTLNMTIQVGRYFEEMGFTVAYTRISDISDTRRTKAAKGEAGNFKLYICIHRNAFSEERANGLEVLYPTGNNVDGEFAQIVCDELDALGLFTKRGLKPRDYHGTISNVSMPVILTELGFITNEKDNTTFDEYFNNIAGAIVRGTMKYAGYATDFAGTVTVNGADHAVSRAEHTVEAGAVAEGSALNYKFVGTHGLGFRYLLVKVDDGAWTTVAPLDSYLSDVAIEHNKNGKSLTYESSVEGLAVGEHTLTVRVGTLLDTNGSQHPVAEEELFVVNFTVKGSEQYALGDVNHDGAVDNLDAALIICYDADVIGADELDLTLADVNGDGKTDAIDASIVLQYDAGLIDELKKQTA